jgi:hypothetical protein
MNVTYVNAAGAPLMVTVPETGCRVGSEEHPTAHEHRKAIRAYRMTASPVDLELR